MSIDKAMLFPFPQTLIHKPHHPPTLVTSQGQTVKEATWKYWTYQEYRDTSLLFARALVALGFQRHGVINILGFNAPEWFFAYMGAMMAGGVAAGIYITNGPEACHVRCVALRLGGCVCGVVYFVFWVRGWVGGWVGGALFVYQSFDPRDPPHAC